MSVWVLTRVTVILKGPQRQHLSDYERQEVLDYPSVYCYGQNSEKKAAHPDRPANNYGYDDERGDYQIVNHDHLAYRYEVLDTLGKGSFGQVLSCRDHCTGQSVAIKIIRNKKRFHHQALVEIKILDNLRKWVKQICLHAWDVLFTIALGCGREASCHQDDRTLLLPESSLYRDGTVKHQPV